MIALDTNVLVRLITKDHAEETRQAIALMESGGAFWVSGVVLLELGWVLSSKRGYGWDRERVSDALHMVVALEGVNVENAERTRRALTWHRAGLDLGDAMMRAAAPEDHVVATFDRAFIADADTLSLAGVRHVTDLTRSP